MIERRLKQRQRVCLEGRLTADLHNVPVAVRVRSISEGGAEIVVPNEAIPAEAVSFSLVRDGSAIKDAKVIWRRMGHFGLQFTSVEASTLEPNRGSSLVREWRNTIVPSLR